LAPETEEQGLAVLGALSAGGNWYELFDIVAQMARHSSQDKDATELRWKLLGEAKLQALLPPEAR
jgi:hypothetical protein